MIAAAAAPAANSVADANAVAVSAVGRVSGF